MATTNFFRQVASLEITGNLQMNIAKGEDNSLVVSLLLQNEACGDSAKNLITPLVFRGTALSIDEAFFEDVKAPIEQTSELMCNMDSYLKQLEEAKKLSAMEKDKSDREKKVKEEHSKKFSEAMAEVEKLDKQGNPRGAWMVLDKLKGYPEHTEVIRLKKQELQQKFEPQLFGTETVNTEVKSALVQAPQEDAPAEVEFDLFRDDEGDEQDER